MGVAIEAPLETLRAVVKQINQTLAVYESSAQAKDENESEHARQKLVEAAKSLTLEAQKPVEFLMDRMLDPTLWAALSVAAGAGFIDALPVNGSAISADEIATKTGAESALIVRIMRMLCAYSLCEQPTPKHYKHGRFTAYFSGSPESKALVMYCTAGYNPALGHLYYLLKENSFRNPVNNGDGSDLTFDKLQPAVQHLIKDDPNREANYTIAMTISVDEKFNVAKYPWPEQCVGVPDVEYALVDVGGSTGQLLDQLDSAFPDWKPKMMLQDQSKVIDLLKARTEQPRFEYMVHDYYSPQPIKAQAYVFRWVWMDNTDDQCRRMLQALKPAFQPKATKLLIVDAALPETGAGVIETAVDILEMTVSGAKTRTVSDFEELLASENFVVTGVWKDGERDQKVLIQAEWEGD